MLYKAMFLFSIALGLAFSQEVERDDYPFSCSDACDPVASAADRCDRQFDDDLGELNCICTTNNMSSLLPECLACVAPFRTSDDYDDGYEEIDELLQACGFSNTSVSGAAPTVSFTVYTTTRTKTDDDGELDTDTDEVTRILTGTAGAASPTQTVVTTTSDGETTVITALVSPTPTDSSAQSASPNAAVITGAPLIGAAAGVMAAMVAL